MNPDYDIRMGINVFSYDLNCPIEIMLEGRESCNLPITLDYFPHAVDVRSKLISKGFKVTEIESEKMERRCGELPQLQHTFDVEISTDDERLKLRELLDSDMYNLVEY